MRMGRAGGPLKDEPVSGCRRAYGGPGPPAVGTGPPQICCWRFGYDALIPAMISTASELSAAMSMRAVARTAV